MVTPNTIAVYTDGSCDPVREIGGWAAIILRNENKITLEGYEPGTSHQRMELWAVIRSLEYLEINQMTEYPVKIYTDSQYVVGLNGRKNGLTLSGFLTKKGLPVRNTDLVSSLIQYMDRLDIEFVKVKAHQKVINGYNFNREVDILCRKIVRKHRK